MSNEVQVTVQGCTYPVTPTNDWAEAIQQNLFVTVPTNSWSAAIMGVPFGLTEPTSQSRVNATSRWLASNYAWLRPKLIKHLEARLRTSRKIDAIEDHVQDFLARLVDNDYLAPYVETGKKIQPSVLQVWAYQHACTEMRGWGTDASLRQTRGALTARERAGVRTAVHPHNPAIELKPMEDDGSKMSDVYQPLADRADTNLEFRELMTLCRNAVSKSVSQNSREKYLNLLDAMMNGDKKDAVVEDHRRTPMVAHIRKVLRDSGVFTR